MQSSSPCAGAGERPQPGAVPIHPRCTDSEQPGFRIQTRVMSSGVPGLALSHGTACHMGLHCPQVAWDLLEAETGSSSKDLTVKAPRDDLDDSEVTFTGGFPSTHLPMSNISPGSQGSNPSHPGAAQVPWRVRVGQGGGPLADPSESCSYCTPSGSPRGKMASSLPLFSEVWQQHRQPALQAHSR